MHKGVSSPQQDKINITWEIGKTGKRGVQDSGGFIPNQEKILGLIIFHNKGIKSLNPMEFSFNFILSFNTIK